MRAKKSKTPIVESHPELMKEWDWENNSSKKLKNGWLPYRKLATELNTFGSTTF